MGIDTWVTVRGDGVCNTRGFLHDEKETTEVRSFLKEREKVTGSMSKHDILLSCFS